MKLNNFLYILLIFLMSGCNSDNNDIVISGNITGNINSDIEYSTSQKGASYWGFAEKIQIDSAGKFEVSMHIDQPAFFELFIGGKPSGVMIIEPGEKYDVSFDIDSEQFNVSGKSSDAQKIYADLNYESDDVDLDKYLSDSTATEIVKRINTAFENEISQFKNLYSSGDISNQFFEFVKNDRECFYSVQKGNIAMNLYLADQMNNSHLYTEEIKKMQSTLFANLQHFSSSFYFYQLAEDYMNYKEISTDSFNFESFMQMVNSDNFNYNFYTIELAQKYLKGEMLEYYLARKLFEESIEMKFQKELLSSFENLKKEFPQSEFTKYLEPQIAPISEYLEIAEKPFDADIKFVADYSKMNSFEECVKSFKGKKVYVDIWATWCLPCRAEFKHKEKLNKLLRNKGYEILYISIDKDESLDQWKEMIRFYNLKGNHVKVNGSFYGDLIRMYDQNGYIAIPWYMILNEDGEIMVEHAKSPSNIEELEKQISEINTL